MNYSEAKVKAEVLKALANPVRAMVVHTLQHGEQCVQDLNRLVKINQSNMSRHLTVLKRAGILGERRTGTKVYFHLQTPGILSALDEAGKVAQADMQQRARRMK